MKLRDHQILKGVLVNQTLLKYKIAYLSGEVRSGKTLTALYAADLFLSPDKSVLIVTKKNAIPSIMSDYEKMNFQYKLNAINYESLHKLEETNYDLVIYDEAHKLGAYPKPSKATKQCKKMFYNIPCILMSGTPATESYSQLYHQFYVSKYSPFASYINFYKWAKDYVDVKQKHIATHIINDYSGAKIKEIAKVLEDYKVVMTQEDAGFQTQINEHILKIDVPQSIKKLGRKLLKDRVIMGNNGYILGDTPAKLKSKLHQLFNGHCIIEKDEEETYTKIFDDYKVKAIKRFFFGRKIAIMYYYKAELDMLKDVFSDDITIDIDEFNTTSKNLAIQQRTTEGMNLSKADCLVYLNFGFSGKDYIQSRDRLTVKDRTTNDVYFVIETGGMNGKILTRIRDKKDYNSYSFKNDFKL